METLERKIVAFVESCNYQGDLDSTNFVEEILNENDRTIEPLKTWVGYGTWKIRLFVNEYHLGKTLAERLRKISVITHDEDKVFSLSDLREEIAECLDNFMYDIWDKEIEIN